MVEVLVVASVGILFLVVCLWSVRSHHQYGKLLYEERLINAKLSITHELVEARLVEVEKMKEKLYAIGESLMHYKVKYGFYPWEVEVDLIRSKDSEKHNDHLLYQQSIEDYKRKYGVAPWEWEEKLIDDENIFDDTPIYDDPLEDFKSLHGFYPWELDEQKEEKKKS